MTTDTRILLIGTAETKAPQLAALTAALKRHGLVVRLVDISLGAHGTVLPGPEKLALMAARGAEAAAEVAATCTDCAAALAIGGGTGGEIALAALQALPAQMPKLLITTLAFDPRAALADCAITLIPTLCDIEGMNPTLAAVFEGSAAMVAGLTRAHPVPASDRPSIAVTTLGVTGPAGAGVAQALAAAGAEATVFHANGYGGAAFARFVRDGGAAGVIDLNVHELGRIRLAGAHVPMPDRFTGAGHLPRIVLPGALNFIGLGEIGTLSDDHRSRRHYRHSGYFTHVKLTETEMADQAAALAVALNTATTPPHILLPMGGFSHEDRPGGAIEDPSLRETCAATLEAAAQNYTTQRLPTHINDPATARAAVAALMQRMPHA